MREARAGTPCPGLALLRIWGRDCRPTRAPVHGPFKAMAGDLPPMTVSVRDARSSERDRLWIQGVYRDYLDDLMPVNATGLFPALGEVGHREPDQMARWFGDRNAFPLVILQGPEHVGFAMVARGSSLPAHPQIDYRMAEFFIARTRRRLGIGRVAVQLILNRFAGRWEISEFQRNTSAVSFWRRVVAAYTHAKYQERLLNGEVRQVFQSGPDRAL